MRLPPVAFALAALGLVLSILLERVHVQAYMNPADGSFCALGARLDCASVALSRFSVLAQIPLPVWGAVGFFAIGVALVGESRWVLPLTAVAAFASLVLLAVEIFAIGALCLLCEAVHVVSFALFGVVLAMRRELTAPLADKQKLAGIFGPPVVVMVALFFLLPRYWNAFGWRGEPPFPHGRLADGAPWIGSPSPKVTIEEFTDYRCGHCKSASARTLRLLAEHPKSVRLVRRQFPRGPCPKRASNACLALRLAYCADEQGKFWPADRWLFAFGGGSKKEIPRMSEDVGLDKKKLETCLGREDLALRSAAEAEVGLARKYKGTPVFVIGGASVPESALDGMVKDLP